MFMMYDVWYLGGNPEIAWIWLFIDDRLTAGWWLRWKPMLGRYPMHPSKTMAFQMRRDQFQMGACTVWILLYFLPQLCVGVPAQKGTWKIMNIKQRDIMLNTLLMNTEWQSNSGCPLPNYFKTISGGDVVEEEEGVEGDTTNATSILACAQDCTAWDKCCSFQFDEDNEDEDEACSLNVACHPTKKVPDKLFCTRGIVDFKRCVGKTRWWPSWINL